MSKAIARVTDLPERKASPSDPFDVGAERAYPRAGVRQCPDGSWKLSLWDEPGVYHVAEATQSTYPDRDTAFSQGWLIIGTHRSAGTRLNGQAAA